MQAQTQFFLEPWLLAIALLDQQLSESIVHHLKYPVSFTIFFKNCFVHYLKFKVYDIYILYQYSRKNFILNLKSINNFRTINITVRFVNFPLCTQGHWGNELNFDQNFISCHLLWSAYSQVHNYSM